MQVLDTGLLFVLSAPSGAGKDSVIKLLKEQNWPIQVAITMTTRLPRQGEVEGVHYYFRTQKEFDALVDQNELLEHAYVHGNWYGVPRTPVREHLLAGEDVLLKIDVQGAETIKKRIPDAVFIFLAPESMEVLGHRLVARKSESEEEVKLRLTNAAYEMEQQQWYDYLVINQTGRLDIAVEKVKAIIQAEHCRVKKRELII